MSRVLVACEFSGVVRDAFRAVGHEAISCDLEEGEGNTEYHYRGDVHGLLSDYWDLMIAHPPCTYLANSGVKHLYLGGKRENGRDEERWENMQEATTFFRVLLSAPIKHIAVENPIMHGYGKAIIGMRQTQIIQPWQYGHGEVKATCLWLKNLPLLQPTDIVEGRSPRVHYASPGPDRWKERSRFLPGIARAMAEQWGAVL